MSAPQMELIPRTLISPAPAVDCGEQVPADDGKGFRKPDYSASLSTRHLHDPRWWGRLIWCRPETQAAPTAVQWRRLVRAYSVPRNPDWPAGGSDGWTERRIVVEDPDGTEHVCSVAQSCAIAATRREWESGSIPLPEIPDYRALDE
ncbi:hypothetical protein ACFORJ_07910 [Corynebacterium hansenii]|uniref:Uncharacterized protein n=1 Tax=Corynebacterium hansenii TaxID=394964 RepID=A0ABV7ZP97_9CORY|nr:hypothetical protein [Corynebacterium hansenii]WJZ00675.1 hypothetical protein CHAN_10370 [Corynebacterium hansenii]